MSSYNKPSGVLDLYRNSIQHLSKGCSVRVKGKSQKAARKKVQKKLQKTLRVKIQFNYQQIEHILGATLPKVIGKLFQCLHAEGELQAALM
uniref:Uncharacterized protein n=1 Tax=Arundo donax TaxID=35708 RepID=A0A0A8ZEV1_ARUDO